LRPGRFDRQITVDRPDVKGREAVLKVHARNKQLNDTVKLDALARYTIGFSGADLENLLNEAALIAARRNRKDIGMDEVEEAFDRIVVGTQKKTRVIKEREKRTVAYHEAGHAVIGHYIENAEEVHRVTIVPRGRAGGYVMMFPKDAEDPLITTKSELFDRVTGLLGGRLAEEIFIGEISSGAYSDFKKATAIVRSMIVDYGMSEKLGPMQFGHTQGQVFLGRDIGHEQNYSEAIAYEIDKEMQNFIRSCYERGREVLKQYEDKVHLIAKTLIDKETLEKDEIGHLLEHGVLPEKPEKANDGEVKVNIQENERDSNELGFDKAQNEDKKDESQD
jgi:cell division protease FtsH